MHIPIIKRRREQGTTLLTVVIVGGLICLLATSTLVMSTDSVINASSRVDWHKAFYTAESAAVWGAQTAFDNTPVTGSSNYYTTANGTLPVAEIICPTNGDTTFNGAWVQI